MIQSKVLSCHQLKLKSVILLIGTNFDDRGFHRGNNKFLQLEVHLNTELRKVCNWLTANRLTLNINKSNYVVFRPYQKRVALKPKIVVYDNVLS